MKVLKLGTELEARVKGMYGEEVEQRQTNESAASKCVWQSRSIKNRWTAKKEGEMLNVVRKG